MSHRSAGCPSLICPSVLANREPYAGTMRAGELGIEALVPTIHRQHVPREHPYGTTEHRRPGEHESRLEGAQRNPGPLFPLGSIPGLRFAPSGLQDIALPVGQNTLTVGQSAPPKIFHFTEFRKRRRCAATRPKEEGRIAIVTNAGRTAVDVGYIGAKGFAGRATVSEDVARTTGVIGVRRNRVVLAPGVCAPSLVVM